MTERFRRPRHSTIVAYLALFVALGGTSYAAINLPRNSVGTAQIKQGAVTSKKIRKSAVASREIRDGGIVNRDIRYQSLSPYSLRPHSIGADQIDKAKLGTVPQAANANTLGGLTAGQLKVTCPAGTHPTSGICIELAPRASQSWGIASDICALAGRRLGTYGELTAFYNFQRPLAPGGELTNDLSESATTPGQLNALVILSETGTDTEFINAKTATQRAFRCVALPAN